MKFPTPEEQAQVRADSIERVVMRYLARIEKLEEKVARYKSAVEWMRDRLHDEKAMECPDTDGDYCRWCMILMD